MSVRIHLGPYHESVRKTYMLNLIHIYVKTILDSKYSRNQLEFYKHLAFKVKLVKACNGRALLQSIKGKY